MRNVPMDVTANEAGTRGGNRPSGPCARSAGSASRVTHPPGWSGCPSAGRPDILRASSGAANGETVTDVRARRRTPSVGERYELDRYTICGAERVLYAQRVNGTLAVIDRPARGRGRFYLVERGLDPGGYRALRALVIDYLSQAELLQSIPMAASVIRRVEQLEAS